MWLVAEANDEVLDPTDPVPSVVDERTFDDLREVDHVEAHNMPSSERNDQGLEPRAYRPSSARFDEHSPW